MKRACLIADVRDWAFDVNNKGIEKYVLYDWEIEHFYVEDLHVKVDRVPDWDRFDLVFSPYHQWSLGIPLNKCFSSLRTQFFGMKAVPPTLKEIELINMYRGFYVVNQRSFDMLKKHCPEIVLLTNPVDTDRFDGVQSCLGRLVVQWNGNARHSNGRVKKIDLIVEACAKAGVELLVREYSLNRLHPGEMASYYEKANVAICASEHEGASNSVMEAMAAGQALITTDCGNAREMQESQMKVFGETGIIIVDPTIDSICHALRNLREGDDGNLVRAMGELNRQEIQERWSWRAWAPRFRDFFHNVLEPAERLAMRRRNIERKPLKDLFLYADTPGWAQHIYIEQLGRAARKWEGIGDVHASTNADRNIGHGVTIYSPVARAADALFDRWFTRDVVALTGLWSHVSYGGWFTDDPLDPALLPAVPTHATNPYLHALTGLPYLSGGVDTDLFCPPTGRNSRQNRHQRDKRIVIGWTGSLQYNAAVKLFADLWLPAVRKSGSDGLLSDARICARPLVVWDCLDARTPAQVAEYLKGIDIYLCTSISEGCSNSVLEAAASGCMVISTPCGNAPEVATEIVGWNVDEIAVTIKRYERNRWALYEQQERTRDRMVRHWSWNSKIKNDAWRAWLGNGQVPSFKQQVPYVHDDPQRLIEISREARLASSPELVRGNMMGS